MTEEGFNRLLDRVEKPARYIGGEYNMQVKDQADLRFALCFPDVGENIDPLMGTDPRAGLFHRKEL